MKVAIVCGHFVPSLGYVEVHIANALHRLGHTVKVITSNETSSSAKYIKSKDSEQLLSYDVVRLKSWFSFGQIVMSKGVKRELLNFTPDKVIVIGLGKIFPKAVFKIENRTFELITLLGDNEDTYSESGNSFKRQILQMAFKKPVYELAILNSDRIVGYTPSTKEVVEAFLNEGLKKIFSKKYTSTSLGFDEMEFKYSNSERSRIREELRINEESLVLITATRITPSKKMERIVDAVETLIKKGLSFKYILIGFSEAQYCKQLKEYIISKGMDEVIITLPFMSREKMNSYYNMADLGLWTQAAISIFEGLATGLFLLLPERKNVSHILTEKTGVYYSDKNLLDKMEQSVLNHNLRDREAIAGVVKSQFSFDVISQKIIGN